MQEFTLTIDGKSVTPTDTFDVINPATETVFAKCPKARLSDLNDAVSSAKRAYQDWKVLTQKQRGKFFEKAADVLNKHKEELGRLLTQEQGKILANAEHEIETAVSSFRNASTLTLPIEILFEDEHSRTELHHKPKGVVAVITPWNYPVSISVGRAVSALVCGNTVVIKPSPYTPITVLRIGELLAEIFPAGVLNVLAGDDDIGEALTKHKDICAITFTGSIPTGKAIAAVAAKELKRVCLELGGNDAAIILDDADIDKIASPIFWGAFSNTGQICIAIKRLYVPEKLHDPLVKKLKEMAEKIKLGDGLDPDTVLGPLNNKAQLDIITNLVEDAKRQGAKIISGGKRMDRPGYFYPPTVVTEIREGVRLVDEEQFGPVLPIIKYSNLDDVIQRANDTFTGLGASVWGTDLNRATNVAARLESGICWVNHVMKLDPHVPFGGVKQSGVGRVFGRWGLEELTDMQTISINKM